MVVERDEDLVAPSPLETSRNPDFQGQLVRSIALAITGIYPAAWLTSRYFKASDLITHFQEPFALVTFITLAFFLLGRRWKIAIVLSLLLGLQCFSITRYLGPNPVVAEPGSSESLRILFANVYIDNQNYVELIRLIDREHPDIIGLVEYTPAWRTALEVLNADYPYSAQAPSGHDAGGVSLWFRKPPVALETPKPLTPQGWPVAHGTFEFAGQARQIWVVHPFSPLGSVVGHDGTNELRAIGKRVKSAEGSRIVVGDMNTTDGSAHFREFLGKTGLRDSRQGFGRQRSWPVDSPYRIAIDHLFLSDDLAVISRRLGPSVHSDHFPLIVDLAPASKTSRTSASQDSKTAIMSP